MRAETAITDEPQSRQVEESPPPRAGFAPLAALRLALWRLGRSFRLLLAVGLGILVAVVLICTVPLYSSLVSNVELQRQLTTAVPSDINIEVDTNIQPVSSKAVNQVFAQTKLFSQGILGNFAPTTTWYLRLGTMFPIGAIDNDPLPSSKHPLQRNPYLQPYVFNLPAALPHMNLLAGRLPRTTPPGQMPEVLVVKGMGLKPGDTITTGLSGLTVKVVGVWTPKNDSDSYWNGNGGAFDPFFSPCFTACGPAPYAAIFDETTFFQYFSPSGGGAGVSSLGVSASFISFPEPSRITVADIPADIGDIGVYRSSLNGSLYDIPAVNSVGVGTQLDGLLKSQEQQFALLTQPLYIIIAQLVALALLFVIAMAALLIESQAVEIATLKSRGASQGQLLLNYGLQGLVVALVAAVIGPILAAGASVAVVRFFVPGAAALVQQQALSSPRAAAQIVSPSLVLEPAVVGALLGLLALVIAAWLAGRRDVLALRREAGRQVRAPFWERYYLDLALVGLAVAGYLELGEFGGLNLREQLGGSGGSGGSGPLGVSGGVGADPLQLVAPALLLVAGALLALRLFPLATRLGVGLARQARGATSLLALAQLDRVRGQFARLALLLTLAVGLGVFALTFQASLSSSTQSAAGFLVGADERVVLEPPTDGTPPTAPFQAQIGALPGVEAITPVYRSSGTNTRDNTPVTLLGIDPATFAAAADWQADDASEPLSQLLHALAAHAQGALAGTPTHPIWTLIDPQLAASYDLAPGVDFSVSPQDSSSATLFFRVAAIVAHFPTLGQTGVSGTLVFNLADYAQALAGPQGAGGFINYIGPNEFWLRTSASAPAARERAVALQNPALWVQTVLQQASVARQAHNDPLAAGMSGLLVLGAGVAALLAVLGCVVQASVAARQRLTQFAILRTLGGRPGQLAGILLAQQGLVYAFGLGAGSVLGAVLSTATLPFLQFSTAALNTSAENLPPFQLSYNLLALAGFYAALVLAFGVALLVGLHSARRAGLGQAIRLGED